MKHLRIDSAARAELLHEVAYYEAVRIGTGRKFREAVEAAFGKIRRTPGSGKPDELECRRVRVRGFPFAVIYREHSADIVVFAVRNDARRPGYWTERARRTAPER